MSKRFMVLDDDDVMDWFDTEMDAAAGAKKRAAVSPGATFFVAEIIGEATAKQESRPVTYKSLRREQ